jgi:outer membrane immunogenic protein
MKKILLATAIAALTTTAAVAEDWTGLYAGASLGYSDDLTDTTVGAQLGYRADLGQFVIGGEAGYQAGTSDLGDGRTSVEGTLGVDAGSVLPYASLGYAWDADSDEGAVFGVGADLRLSGGNLVGVKATYDDFGATDTNLSIRYSFQF